MTQFYLVEGEVVEKKAIKPISAKFIKELLARKDTSAELTTLKNNYDALEGNYQKLSQQQTRLRRALEVAKTSTLSTANLANALQQFLDEGCTVNPNALVRWSLEQGGETTVNLDSHAYRGFGRHR